MAHAKKHEEKEHKKVKTAHKMPMHMEEHEHKAKKAAPKKHHSRGK